MFDHHGYSGFPQRSKFYAEDLMSLNTITEKDAPPKCKKWNSIPSKSLVTQDIDGARPVLKGYGHMRKQEFANTTDGIDRARPAHLHQKLNREEYNLSCKDIQGAYPKKAEFSTTRIGTNPLNPVYKLPYYETRPITPPKYIRDSIDINDIEGTRPEIYYKWNTRNNMTTHDIEGAKPKPETTWTKPNLVNPDDINKDGLFKTTRCTNPIVPTYQVRNEDEQVLISQVTEIGEVVGSRPKVYVDSAKPVHSRHLTTQDIEGAQTGSVGVGPLKSHSRSQVRHPCDAQDIVGAQSGSLKKGITTMRQSNPLVPEYQAIGRSEELAEQQPKIEVQKPLTGNPQYDKDHARFWGVTPPPSVGRATTIKSSEGPRRNQELIRSAARFFQGKPSSNPDDDQLNFQQNAQTFYQNPKTYGHPKFENVYNKASIHRKKPQIISADDNDAKYNYNQKQFYGAPSSAGSVANSEAKSVSSDLHLAARKFYGDNASQASSQDRRLKQNTAKFYDNPKPVEPYNFKLNRSNIGRPGKPPVNPLKKEFNSNNHKFFGVTPPASSGRNSYIAAAEKFYAS